MCNKACIILVILAITCHASVTVFVRDDIENMISRFWYTAEYWVGNKNAPQLLSNISQLVEELFTDDAIFIVTDANVSNTFIGHNEIKGRVEAAVFGLKRYFHLSHLLHICANFQQSVRYLAIFNQQTIGAYDPDTVLIDDVFSVYKRNVLEIVRAGSRLKIKKFYADFGINRNEVLWTNPNLLSSEPFEFFDFVNCQYSFTTERKSTAKTSFISSILF